MKTTTIIIASVLALGAACTKPDTQCERTMGMSKGGVPIMLGEPCVTAPAYVPRPAGGLYRDNEGSSWPTPTETPTSSHSTPSSGPDEPTGTPDEPTGTPDEPTGGPDEPTGGPDRPRGDNSDANGKEGNKHDRDDFTHGGTEIAEGKKDD